MSTPEERTERNSPPPRRERLIGDYPKPQEGAVDATKDSPDSAVDSGVPHVLSEEVLSPVQAEKEIEDAGHFEIDSVSDTMPKPEQKGTGIAPIRTYEQDVANAIKKSNVSVTDMALAEQKRMQKEKKPPLSAEELKKSRKLTLKIIGGLVIVTGIAVGAISLGIPEYRARQIELAIIPPELITVDDRNEIEVAERDSARLIDLLAKKIENNKVPLGSIRHLYFTARDEASEEGKRVITIQELIDHLDLGAPESLVRSLSGEYMLGLHSFDGNVPFLILGIDSFDNAFASMLAWEEAIENAEEPFFEILMPQEIAQVVDTVAPSDQSTTTSTTTSPLRTPLFEDHILFKQDARGLLHPDGKTRLIYSFVTPRLLVITSSEGTFKELLSRLNIR